MDATIDEAVRDVALRHLGERFVSRVFTEPTANSWGEDALRIVIVLRSSDVTGISGDMVVDTLVDMSRVLTTRGDMRQPLVEYGTEDDLASEDDDDADSEF